MSKYFFLLILTVIVTSSCTKNQDKKPLVETKVVKMPADTVFVKSPPKIIQLPSVVGSRVLYVFCRNTVTFDTPEAFSDFKITLDMSQTLKTENNPKKWVIIPRKKGKLTINYKAKLDSIQYEWSEHISVIEPPKPTIQLFINGKITNGMAPVPKNSRFQIKIVPDKDFKALFPEEANYGISSVDVLAQFSLGPPTKVNSVNGRNANNGDLRVTLGTQVRQARPGTKVFMKINEVYRLNSFKQRIIDKRFSEVDKVLAITVR